MKKAVLALLLSLTSASISHANEFVVCSTQAEVPVYKNDIKTINFAGRKYESVVPFQSFGLNTMVIYSQGNELNPFFTNNHFLLQNPFTQPSLIKVIGKDRKETLYIRAEFIDRQDDEEDNNIGWVEQSLLKAKKACAGYQAYADDLIAKANKDHLDPENNTASDSNEESYLGTKVTGLLDKNCCLFPMKKRATESFTDGMRRFGAGRSKGARTHAAADLYQSQYQPVYAIAAGKVLVDRAPFYLGTNVTEIQHPGGFIARYGEIASERLKPLKLGDEVKAGQLIGYIKKVNSRTVYSAMLHFELYTGKASGPLTVKKGKYQRRSDLINPTAYLLKWEEKLK